MWKLKTNKRKLLKYRGEKCLNCNYSLNKTDRYCPKCSQLNSTKRITLIDLFRDFFDVIFSYDSKFRKTTWTLIRYPGKATKEYTSGKKASYSNPFRFFLSMSFIYIIILLLTFDLSQVDEFAQEKFSEKYLQETAHRADSIQQIVRDSLDIIAPELKDTTKISAPFSAIKLVSNREQKEKKEINKDSIHFFSAKKYFDSLATTNLSFTDITDYKSDVFKYGIEKQNMRSYSHLLEEMKIEDTWENQISYKLGLNYYKIKTTPSLYLSFIISKLPFLVFFTIPFLAFFIWLVYQKKAFYYMDHMVFCYQTLTILIFSVLLWTVSVFFTGGGILSSSIFLVFFIYNLIYLYLAMRRFYGQGRLKTFVKYIYIHTIFSILAIIATIIFSIISFILY